MRLHDFSVLTFDCYGTLIDWETGIWRAFAPALERAPASRSRDDVLEAFARHEAVVQAASPALLYPEVLAEVYRQMCREFGIEPDGRAAAAFGASVPDWPPFPDSPQALAYLKQHYRLVILSNVDRESFRHSSVRLRVAFDAVVTAQDVGSYKPDARNFRYMLDRLAEQGIAREQILHTAESLHHDHVPAKQLGLRTCWIHRRHAQPGFGATRPPEVEVSPDFRFQSLAAMADAHRAEAAA